MPCVAFKKAFVSTTLSICELIVEEEKKEKKRKEFMIFSFSSTCNR